MFSIFGTVIKFYYYLRGVGRLEAGVWPGKYLCEIYSNLIFDKWFNTRETNLTLQIYLKRNFVKEKYKCTFIKIYEFMVRWFLISISMPNNTYTSKVSLQILFLNISVSHFREPHFKISQSVECAVCIITYGY